jgi:hypothetical protein
MRVGRTKEDSVLDRSGGSGRFPESDVLYDDGSHSRSRCPLAKGNAVNKFKDLFEKV